VGFRGPNGHRNNELDDKIDVHRVDRSTQRLSNARLVSQINHVLSEILSIIHNIKSLFGEAAAKSDRARSETDFNGICMKRVAFPVLGDSSLVMRFP
jgi:hypothetical protein